MTDKPSKVVARPIQFRGREDKLRLTAAICESFLSGIVLDVGCAEKVLQKFVHGRYIGIDLSGMPDIVANAEDRLPFRDRSFDTVVNMDNLEHINNIHFAFDELCRVAKKFVVIGLPNMYEWRFRLNFILGKTISGKYAFPLEIPLDRHRWLLSLRDAKAFVNHRGQINGFCLVDERVGYYLYKRLLARWVTFGGRLCYPYGTQLFAYHYLAVLERKASETWVHRPNQNGL